MRPTYGPKPKTNDERLWAKVDQSPDQGPNGECWEWQGSRNPKGYGNFVKYLGPNDYEYTNAHRVAYELANGEIGEGMFVCHRCDNPPCCNPDHLFLGTQKENIADSIAKKRYRGCAQPGEKHHNAKLNPDAIREIRKRADAGEPYPSIATAFGVTGSTIGLIRRRKRWAHVADEAHVADLAPVSDEATDASVSD